jgi:F-type H+-transporting ATPase subunit b
MDINMLTLLPSLIVGLEKTGGLFDIDATLPVLIIQFFLLVQLLKIILFNPLQKVLQQREEEIENNLKNARISLEDVEKLQFKIRRLLEVIRDRHSSRAKEVESKRQAALIKTKKFLESEVRNKRNSLVNAYRSTALEASDLIPTVVKELNKYLRRRPPKRRVYSGSSNFVSK